MRSFDAVSQGSGVGIDCLLGGVDTLGGNLLCPVMSRRLSDRVEIFCSGMGIPYLSPISPHLPLFHLSQCV